MRERIVRAALGCVARQGVAKTTVDDIARQAGCSRATVYRTVGAKDDVLRAAVQAETGRLFEALGHTLDRAAGPEDALTEAIATTASLVSDHGALTFLLEHEPEVVLPHLAFGALDGLLGLLGSFVAGYLTGWMDADDAGRVAELAVRVTISYLACPAEGMLLTDPGQARHVVRRFILAGFSVTPRHRGTSTSTSTVVRTAHTDHRTANTD